MIPKKCKTPLRYPGGKSRATQKMFAFLPDMDNITAYHEGFIGGGSVAIAFARLYPNIPIWINDKYYPLFNFWTVLQSSSAELSERLLRLKEDHPNQEKAKELFLRMKDVLLDEKTSEFDMAAAFFIVNKCSFSGLTQSSSFSKAASDSNFSRLGIANLVHYGHIMQGWKITNLDYSELLTDDPNTFVYLDPPYDIKDSLYGNKGSMHKGFDHDEFARLCSAHSAPTMISYNDDERVTDRFGAWTHHRFPLTYTMRSTGSYSEDQKGRLELLMVNY